MYSRGMESPSLVGWNGRYFSNKESLEVAVKVDKGDVKMSIAYDEYSKDGRILKSQFPCNIPHWPKKSNAPYFVVVDKQSGVSVLQKIEIRNPLDHNGTIIIISEFEIFSDYFDLVAPDDEKKLMRKFQFVKSGSCLVELDLFENKQFVKKLMIYSEADSDSQLVNLPDMETSEMRANTVFKHFREEVWCINDGILAYELERVEYEIKQKGIRSEELENKYVDLISEDMMWEERQWELNEESDLVNENCDNLVTEDDILEHRTLEQLEESGLLNGV